MKVRAVLFGTSGIALATSLAALLFFAPAAWAERPNTDRHVAELARYLDGVVVHYGVRCGADIAQRPASNSRPSLIYPQTP
jgi:hypothetical protein